MNTILVQMADRQWTEEALHLACAMARNSETPTTVTMLRLIYAQNYGWLGTSFGSTDWLTKEDSDLLWGCKAIAEHYEIELLVQPMQWMTYVGAIVDASDDLESGAVFACVPQYKLPFWRKFQIWDLRRQLEKRGRTLYTLDQPVQSLILATQVGALRQQV